MFRVYKPKNIVRVKAVQVTTQNIADLAQLLMGRVIRVGDGDNPTGISVATFDGVKDFPVGCWILRSDENELSSMTDEEFQGVYEVARNTSVN